MPDNPTGTIADSRVTLDALQRCRPAKAVADKDSAHPSAAMMALLAGPVDGRRLQEVNSGLLDDQANAAVGSWLREAVLPAPSTAACHP